MTHTTTQIIANFFSQLEQKKEETVNPSNRYTYSHEALISGNQNELYIHLKTQNDQSPHKISISLVLIDSKYNQPTPIFFTSDNTTTFQNAEEDNLLAATKLLAETVAAGSERFKILKSIETLKSTFQ